MGAVDVDSGWSTGFNNFIVDSTKYPDPKDMVAQFHALNVRVIFWVTSMVDTDSSNFEVAPHGFRRSWLSIVS